MLFTIIQFKISTECVEFATVVNIGICHLLPQASSINTIINRPFFHDMLFCGDAISLLVVSEVIKTWLPGPSPVYWRGCDKRAIL